MKYLKKLVVILLVFTCIFASFSGSAFAVELKGWREDNKEVYYYTDKSPDLFYTDGIYKINGKYYLFDANGLLVDKNGWAFDKKYYINKNGTVRTGWLKKNGKIYYFSISKNADSDSYSVVKTRYNVYKEKGKYVYYSNKGKKITKKGWTSDGRYYITGKGTVKTGWLNSGGKRYYFKLEKDGNFYNISMAKNEVVKIGGKHYCFDNTGAVVSKPGYYDNGNLRVRKDGTAKVGWYKLDGRKYYFHSRFGRYNNGVFRIKKKYYLFDSEGFLVDTPGWTADRSLFITSEGTVAVGWLNDADRSYYFNHVKAGENNRFIISKAINEVIKLGGRYYYLDQNGEWLKTANWVSYKWRPENVEYSDYYQLCTIHINIDGSVTTGWYQENNKWYYFGIKDRVDTETDQQFYYRVELIRNNTVKVGKYLYRMDANGIWISNKGWYPAAQDYNTKSDLFYVNNDGTLNTETFDENGIRYYFNKYGRVVNKIRTDESAGWHNDSYHGDFYLKSQGKAAQGWTKVNDKWYYLKENSSPETYRYIDENGQIFFFNSNGTWVTKSGWFHDTAQPRGLGWHYLDRGRAIRGWKKVDGSWYYFDKNSNMVQNGVFIIKGRAYDFAETGICLSR